MTTVETIECSVRRERGRSGDRDEPQHVHVERDDRIAKFWLDPIRLQGSGGFSRIEIARIEKLVSNHRIELTEAWNEYFGR